MVEKITAYKDLKGQVHEHETDAIKADARISLYRWSDAKGIGRGGEWSEEMIVNLMIENAGELQDILHKIHTCHMDHISDHDVDAMVAKSDSFINVINHPEVFADIPWPADKSYQWWGVDKDGLAWFHKNKPTRNTNGELWCITAPFFNAIKDDHFAHAHLADELWDQTLTQRPNVLRDHPPLEATPKVALTPVTLAELQSAIVWPEDTAYIYWAIDKNGNMTFFDDTEEPQNTGAEWFASFFDNNLDPIMSKNHFPEDTVADFWMNSLTKRPAEISDNLAVDPETPVDAIKLVEAQEALQEVIGDLTWDNPSAIYWSMDENGDGWYNEEEPSIAEKQWLGVSIDCVGEMKHDLAKLVWKQSLTKRPEMNKVD